MCRHLFTSERAAVLDTKNRWSAALGRAGPASIGVAGKRGGDAGCRGKSHAVELRVPDGDHAVGEVDVVSGQRERFASRMPVAAISPISVVWVAARNRGRSRRDGLHQSEISRGEYT